MWAKTPVKVAAVVLLIVVAVGVGLWLHAADRTVGDSWHAVGTTDPDRVEVYASVQRVDAAAREMTLRVLVVPKGRTAEDNGVAPSGELRLLSSSSLRGDQVFPAHQTISGVDLPIALSGGTVTDYPFDHYQAHVQFAATLNGEQVPVLLTLDKVDSLFSLSINGGDGSDGLGTLDVTLGRSVSVLVFAIFMMVTMWALAIAVLLGAWHLVSRRRGLIWPAFGFMAATLFALAGFRNVAPGAPPFGSLLDYSAFLWAELIVALSVVVAVVVGAVAEKSG